MDFLYLFTPQVGTFFFLEGLEGEDMFMDWNHIIEMRNGEERRCIVLELNRMSYFF